MRCVCRPANVKILGILAILAISLHIGYEQGPVVDMEGPAHRVATVLLRMRNAKTCGCRLAALGSRRCRAAARFARLPLFGPLTRKAWVRSGQ